MEIGKKIDSLPKRQSQLSPLFNGQPLQRSFYTSLGRDNIGAEFKPRGVGFKVTLKIKF